MKKRDWRRMILLALREKPLRISDLIELLGFDAVSSGFDAMTRVSDGLKPLHGSFIDSRAQRVLAAMVEDGSVDYQRAYDMTNWYKLPDHDFPPEAAVRDRSLKNLLDQVWKLLPDDVINGVAAPDFDAMQDQNVWEDFSPFVLQMNNDGWGLSDGDPRCNWASNTFEANYPIDVNPQEIADRIVSEWRTTWRAKAGKQN